MESLVSQFTKNLSGCSGCGSNGTSEQIYNTWLKAKEKGEGMKFQFAVVIEADTYKEAVAQVPDEFEILSGGVKPEPKIASGIQTSGQFARTTTAQVNG